MAKRRSAAPCVPSSLPRAEARQEPAPTERTAEEAGGGPAVSRRTFLVGAIQAHLAAAAGAVLGGCRGDVGEKLSEFFQRHYQELSEAELEAVLERLERQHRSRLGMEVEIRSTPPVPGVRFGMALDLATCIGCARCLHACNEENNQSHTPLVTWITMLRSSHKKVWLLEDTEHYLDPPEEEDDRKYHLPVACQHCEHPACVDACPTKATWKEPDGIVVVDYNWCIGCRCCMAACPYNARKFNWAEPEIAADDVNPEMHYLGNRLRMAGVVEKCTFCVHRTRTGRNPACVEACPAQARHFGDLNDPESELYRIATYLRTTRLREELGTEPNFFYFFSMGPV